jgi:flavin-dependent dehydrogenase
MEMGFSLADCGSPSIENTLTNHPTYDVAIIGGGLGGLSLAIQLAREHFRVIVIEKESYPFHRVCGEYISLESWNFLESLGVPLSDMELPIIKNLLVSSPNGNTISQALPLGGFGISRFKIDNDLVQLARINGATVMESVKVNDVLFNGEGFEVQCSSLQIQAKLVAGSFGKRSNLDMKWKRAFASQKPGKLNNFIAVKYHIKANFPVDSIGLHNFPHGYCGISRVENNNYCLCYLTTAKQLKNSGNEIEALERTILYKNPHLAQIFKNADFLWKEPLTIAQISFSKKKQIENHVILLGDAAGMVTPLCGNGMSMAMHSSKLVFTLMKQFLHGEITRQQMELYYIQQWNKQFSNRMRTGRIVQRLFGKPLTTNLFILLLKPFPKIISWLIRQTHGEPF